MTTPLKSIGLRPGSYATYNTMSLLKFFAGFVLVVLIITWICFELFDYIPSSSGTEPFQNATIPLTLNYKPISTLDESRDRRIDVTPVALHWADDSMPVQTVPDTNQNTDTYYKPVPRPANNIQNPDANMFSAGATYDADILRANRYYNTTDGLSREIPVTNLLSLTNEMPTTYMMSVLDTIKTTDSAFSFPVTPGLQGFIDYYTQAPNDLSKKPTNMVLRNLSKLSPQDLSEVAELAELFAICRLWLITKINMAVLDDKLSSPSHPFSQFQIINSRNTKLLITNPEGTIIDGLTLICDMMIHRPYKTNTFNIQTTINIIPGSNNTINCMITDIRLIGSTINGEAQLNDGITPVAFNGIHAGSAPVSVRSPASIVIPNAADIAIGDYSAGSVGLEKNMAEYKARQEFNKDKTCGDIDTRNRLYESARAAGEPSGQHGVASPLQNIDATTRRYLELNCGGKCFGVNPKTNAVIELFQYNDSKLACESTHNELDGNVGVYDYPCKQDTDCPYYKANKNYPNTFGKCVKATGVCEMPEGVVRMGYKLEHKQGQAKCNNCAKLPGYETNTLADEACCVEQQNSLSLLKINSPDYRFRGDYTVRRQPDNLVALEKLGLNP